jgi:hypothetical protein
MPNMKKIRAAAKKARYTVDPSKEELDQGKDKMSKSIPRLKLKLKPK